MKTNRLPVLHVVGSDDELRVAAEASRDLIAGSTLVVLDGLDHVSTETSPAFRQQIQSFLAKSGGNSDKYQQR